MLYYQTITADTLGLLKKLQNLPVLKNTRLVGGTALALRIGHRRSIDIDLFGELNVELDELNQELNKAGVLKQIKQSPNIQIYILDNVKVDIVNYTYPWIDELLFEDGIRIAGLGDIAAMKVSAITGRGSRKDFIDFYFLLQQFSLKEILNFYSRKYKDGSQFLALKSLVYFEDAEEDPMPDMLIPVNWQEVKRRITASCKDY